MTSNLHAFAKLFETLPTIPSNTPNMPQSERNIRMREHVERFARTNVQVNYPFPEELSPAQNNEQGVVAVPEGVEILRRFSCQDSC